MSNPRIQIRDIQNDDSLILLCDLTDLELDKIICQCEKLLEKLKLKKARDNAS